MIAIALTLYSLSLITQAGTTFFAFLLAKQAPSQFKWGWIFLGIGLAVGICLEVIKSPAGKARVHLAGFTRFETILDEGREVRIPLENLPSLPLLKRAKKSTQDRADEAIVPHQLSKEELPPTTTVAHAQPATPSQPPPKPETPEEKKEEAAGHGHSHGPGGHSH